MEAVLLHEIGHSRNKSLLFKYAVAIIVHIIEMLAILAIYTFAANNQLFSEMSTPAAFITGYVVYLLVLQRWLYVFKRIASQAAELGSDLFARDQDLGADLANVLFKISLQTTDYIYTTVLYNFFKSDHPTIYQRIEYLSNCKS